MPTQCPHCNKTISTQRTCVDILQQNSEAGIAELWDVERQKYVPKFAVELAFNEGRGTGRQTIAMEDFGSFLGTLSEISFYPSRSREDTEGMVRNLDRDCSTTIDVLRASWYLDSKRNAICFRTRVGRGNRPAYIPVDEFGQVLESLLEMQRWLVALEPQCWKNWHQINGHQV